MNKNRKKKKVHVKNNENVFPYIFFRLFSFLSFSFPSLSFFHKGFETEDRSGTGGPVGRSGSPGSHDSEAVTSTDSYCVVSVCFTAFHTEGNGLEILNYENLSFCHLVFTLNYLQGLSFLNLFIYL